MFLYVQSSGKLYECPLIGAESLLASGYSGHGEGKNNHARQSERCVGPIPVGAYAIGSPRDSKDHGPFVLPLTPLGGTKVGVRSAFLLHGDSIEHPGEASEGCIIISRAIRERVANSHDTLLVVISGLAV